MSEQQQERYIDPNSGAAPQPGGYAHGGAVVEEPEVVEATEEPTTEEESTEESEATEETTGGDETTEVEDAQTGPAVESEYDPADYGVEDVVKYVEQHPEEKASILAKEEAGKNRVTLVSQLQD